MICLVVQVQSNNVINKVVKQLNDKFPSLNLLSDSEGGRLILYQYNETITKELISNIMRHEDVICVMIDDYDSMW